MASLSKKQLRKAAPLEALPFEVSRKYGEPSLHATMTQVRAAIDKDLDALEAQINRIGSGNDRMDLELLRERAAVLVDGCNLPWSVDQRIDEYTGTRYRAVVRDRRQG